MRWLTAFRDCFVHVLEQFEGHLGVGRNGWVDSNFRDGHVNEAEKSKSSADYRNLNLELQEHGTNGIGRHGLLGLKATDRWPRQADNQSIKYQALNSVARARPSNGHLSKHLLKNGRIERSVCPNRARL